MISGSVADLRESRAPAAGPHARALRLPGLVERCLLTRPADLVGSALIALIVASLALAWHRSTESAQLPFFDGSRHVAWVANLVAALRADGPAQLAAYFSLDPQTFTAYAFLAIPTFIVGPGRLAFGVGWAACLVLILAAVWLLLRRETGGPARSLLLALLLFPGLYQSRDGGIWDTRIDIFAITLGFLMLVAMVRGRTFATVGLLLAASFAKGAALPLFAPMVLGGFLLGYLPVRRPRLGFGVALRAAAVCALAAVYVAQIWPRAVSYNLMATRADPDQRAAAFAANWWAYLSTDPLFYGTELALSYRGWIAAVALALLAVGAWRRWPADLLRLGLLASGCFAYTYLLMTVSPLHNSVLTVWFFPALGLVALFLTRVAVAYLPRWLPPLLALALLVPTVGALPGRYPGPPPAYAAPTRTILGEVDQMASYLDGRFAGRSARVAVLANFWGIDGPVQHVTDTYRTLLHERLRRANLVLDGWELGAFSEDWLPELRMFRQYDELLLLIQQQPFKGIPHQEAAGRSFRDHFERIRAERPDCFEQVAAPIRLPKVGQQTAWMVSADPDCRARLFKD